MTRSQSTLLKRKTDNSEMKASKERKVIKQYSVAVECYPYIAYPQPSENEIVAKENIDESNSQQIVERPIVMAKRITRATSTKSKNIPSTALKSERVTRATSTKSKNIESTLLQTGNIVETSLKRKADSSEMKASKKRKVTKQYSVSLGAIRQRLKSQMKKLKPSPKSISKLVRLCGLK